MEDPSSLIANARMYSVTAGAAALWRRLLQGVVGRSGLAIEVIEHAPPAPIGELWRRRDKAAVFMCGLPYSMAAPRPELVAAPVPSPPRYHGRPHYWSDLVVRVDSPFHRLEDTFGHRIAFTTPQSQSGYAAPLHTLQAAGGRTPLYREIIAPRLTPVGALTAVIEGLAEVAPIDSYAFDLLGRHAPELTSQVRAIARTAPTPIPPLVASAPELGRLAPAFLEAHGDPALRAIMDELLVSRFVQPDPASYDLLRQRLEAATAFWRRHPLAGVTHPTFAL